MLEFGRMPLMACLLGHGFCSVGARIPQEWITDFAFMYCQKARIWSGFLDPLGNFYARGARLRWKRERNSSPSAIANNAAQAPSGSLFRCGPPREPEGQPGIAANGGCPQLMSALLPRRALRSDGTFRRIVASTYEGIARLNK